MRVYVLNFTDIGIHEPRGRKLAQSLAGRGHAVHWVCGERAGRESLAGVHVTALPIPGFLPLRVRELLYLLLAPLWMAVQPRDANAVAVGYSHVGAVAASAARALRGTPYAVDYPDPLYATDPHYARYAGTLTRLAAPLFEALEARALRRAALVTVISPHFARHVQRRYGVPAARTLVLPNAPDPALFRAGDPRRPLRTLVYAGKAIPEYGLEFLLDAFANARARVPRLRLLLAVKADARERAWLDERLRHHGLAGPASGVTVRANTPYEKMPGLLASGEVGVLPYPPSPINDAALPNKLFEYLAAGLAVLCTPVRETRALVEREKVGYACASPADFARRAEHLARNPRVLASLRRRARALALERFNWPRAVDALEHRLEAAGAPAPRHRP